MSFGLLFTYVMAYGGSAVALVNPYVGLLIYVCFAILKPGPGLWYWSVPDGNYSKVLAISLLVGWALRLGGDWRLGRAQPVVWSLVAYLAWNAVAAVPALRQDVAWGWVEEQAKIVSVVVVGATLIDSVAKLRQMAWVILLSHGYVAYDLNMSYFSGFNRLHEIGFGGMDNNSFGIALVSCTGLGIFLCLGAAKWWQQVAAAASVGCMVHAILFSFSRGAMLGLAVVVATSFLLIPRRPIHYAALVAGIALVLAFSGQQVVDRFRSSFAEEGQRDESAESRVTMWGICARVTGENPVVGLGPRHFSVYAETFGLTPNKEAHTTWLQLSAELGVPGAAFLVAFYLITLARLWPLTRRSAVAPDPFLKDVARMVTASTIGFVFTAQFVTLPGLEAPYYIVLLGVGALRLISAGAASPVGVGTSLGAHAL